MKQLILDFNYPFPSAFENFVSLGNDEVMQALKTSGTERFIYLWGETGSGKSHLLQAWNHHWILQGKSSLYVDAAQEQLPEAARTVDCLAVDHVEKLDAAGQIMLFSFYNSLKQKSEGQLLMAGRLPPMQMPLRDDLRSRLGWGLVFEVKGLDDEAKLSVLCQHAAERQIKIGQEIFRYLLTHWRRDLPSLVSMIEALDRYSLAMHRPITLPLLKQLLNMIDEGEYESGAI